MTDLICDIINYNFSYLLLHFKSDSNRRAIYRTKNTHVYSNIVEFI